jgi:glycosyltransferase involved in cell wall biosynthesis
MALMEQRHDWGFHIFAIAAYMLDLGLADEAEFWDYRNDRFSSFHPTGVRRVSFFNQADLDSYLRRFGYPDLIVNYGQIGVPVLESLSGKSFRVSVPCVRSGKHLKGNFAAECYLVDAEEHLDSRSMLYVPMVHTGRIFPVDCKKERDFIYLASAYPAKRHDLLIQAVRGSKLTGHLHPVAHEMLDLRDTLVTTSSWYEHEVAQLLTTSRIAVYPGDRTSNPAAMWECVAAGLPIVVNQNILGGRHLVIPGVTGELASPQTFRQAIEQLLAKRQSYRPSKYFESHWNTTQTLDRYLEFFQTMGLRI